MTVQDDIVTRAKANHHDIASGPATVEQNIRRRTIELFTKTAADSMAGDTTATTALVCKLYIPAHWSNGVRLVSLTIIPVAAMAADNTDYVTTTIKKVDGAGGAGVSVATYDSRAANNGALAAFVPLAMTLTATLANREVAAGSTFTFEIAKAGAGKIVPISSYVAVVDIL